MHDSIRKKLETLVERHQELSHLLSDAQTISDSKKFRELSKEYAQLSPVVDCFGRFQQAQADVTAAESMLKEPDPEMQQMAKEDLAAA